MSDDRCCCSKESTGTIPIMRIIDKLDNLLAKNDVAEAEHVLEYWESEARSLNDTRGLSEILSEEIGFYRSTGNKEKGLRAVEDALSILCCTDIGDSVANATIYLNCATTMKAFGKTQDALPYYEKAREVYERLLPNDDFRLAGYYNNYATALCELKHFDEARDCYEKAVSILTRKSVFGELAVTYVNLAQLAYDEDKEIGKESDDKIDELLGLAYECLNRKELERNGSYASICRKCADAFGFFGYFMQKEELEERAREIYKNN